MPRTLQTKQPTSPEHSEQATIHIDRRDPHFVCTEDGYQEPVELAIEQACRLFRDADMELPIDAEPVAAIAMDDENNFWIPTPLDQSELDELAAICGEDYNQHIYRDWFTNRTQIIVRHFREFSKRLHSRQDSLEDRYFGIHETEDRPVLDEISFSEGETDPKPEAEYAPVTSRSVTEAWRIWFYAIHAHNKKEPILTLERSPTGRFFATRVESSNTEIMPLAKLLQKLGLR